MARCGVCHPGGASGVRRYRMDVFEPAALATIVQVAIWLFLVVIKTLRGVWQMVRNGKEKPGEPSRNHRVK